MSSINTNEVKMVLENKNIVNWVKKIEIGELEANGELKAKVKNLGVETTEESVGISSKDFTSMLITNSSYDTKDVHTKLSIELLQTIFKLGIKGDLVIRKGGSQPAIVQVEDSNDLIVIAPKVVE